jgi:RNA polymerase sigma-70 factor (sigma-E family)
MLADVSAESRDEVEIVDTDFRSFAQLFEDQRRGALRLAFAMTGDAHIAEDVVAEAFARTFRNWAAGRVHDPESYVRRAVVNEVRSTWRRLEVRRRHAARERRTAQLSPSSSAIDRIGDVDVMQRALQTLSPRVRAAVVLRIVEDLSERQTAEVLGCSVGSVKGYLSRGLDRLREELGAGEGDSDE